MALVGGKIQIRTIYHLRLENGLNVFPLDEIKRIKDTFQSEYYNLHRSVIEKKIHLYGTPF